MARYFRPSSGPLEKAEQSKILRWIEEQGFYVFKTINTSKAGVPDIICCAFGRFIALEVKRIGLEKNLTMLQSRNVESIRESGGLAEVVSTLEDVKCLFRHIQAQQERT